MRSFKTLNACGCFFSFFHFSLYATVRSKFVTSGTQPQQNALSREWERKKTLFLTKGEDVVVNDDERRLFLLALFAFLFSVSREREREFKWLATLRRRIPRTMERRLYPWSRRMRRKPMGWTGPCTRPASCPLYSAFFFVILSFFYVYSNERDETMRSSPFWIRLNSNIVAAFWHEHDFLSLSLLMYLYFKRYNTETSWPRWT